MSNAVLLNGQGIPGMPQGSEATEGQNIRESEHSATETSVNVPPSQEPPESPQSGFGWSVLGIYALVFAGMWFLLIRPQRKREKAMRELQSSITTGDNIITSGGLFGKVADVGEDCFVVEFGTNRGVRIPVNKADVVAVRTPKMTSTSVANTD